MLHTRNLLDSSERHDLARERLRTFERSASNFLGMLTVLAVTCFYAVTLVCVYGAHSILSKVIFAALNGLAIGLLFIAGHDACHGALTASKKLNAILGRFCLLPSLHPYTAWVFSHNGLHHSWANLKGRDPVYAPLTLQEYRSLSPLRRMIERIERSIFGVGLLYLHTVWWRHEVAPEATGRRKLERRGPYLADCCLVGGYLAAHLVTILVFTMTRGSGTAGFALAAFWGVICPFFVWNWLMGFVTYQHHTHPNIPWFDNIESWSADRSQMLCTANVCFPEAVDWLLLRIMNHSAHHLDPTIPLYRLRRAQAQLSGEAQTFRWSLKGCIEVFRACKLYDFKQHRWLDFNGQPLHAVVNPHRSVALDLSE